MSSYYKKTINKKNILNDHVLIGYDPSKEQWYLSGHTYPFKEAIKEHLDGKWDSHTLRWYFNNSTDGTDLVNVWSEMNKHNEHNPYRVYKHPELGYNRSKSEWYIVGCTFSFTQELKDQGAQFEFSTKRWYLKGIQSVQAGTLCFQLDQCLALSTTTNQPKSKKQKM